MRRPFITERRTRRLRTDPLEEISELTEVNRVSPDREIERRLVQLRLDAMKGFTPTGGPASWPPQVPDRFPDVAGLPEIPRRELTPEVLRSAIVHHGALLVRGLLSPPTAGHLITEMDRVLAAQEAYGIDPTRAEGDQTFRPFEKWSPDDAWAYENGSVLAIDAPGVFFDLVETFEHAGIGELAKGFFGEHPTMLAKKWTLRRVPPDITMADWHQDGSFMGSDIRSLNVWISLSHCGEDAPSMDVVARRLDCIAETGTEGAHFDWSVGPAVAEHVADGTIVRPRFTPGDALLFDHFLLHKTDTHPGMTEARYAIEAWFASAATAPPDQLPIVY